MADELKPFSVDYGEAIKIKDRHGNTVATMNFIYTSGRRSADEVGALAELLVNAANSQSPSPVSPSAGKEEECGMVTVPRSLFVIVEAPHSKKRLCMLCGEHWVDGFKEQHSSSCVLAEHKCCADTLGFMPSEICPECPVAKAAPRPVSPDRGLVVTDDIVEQAWAAIVGDDIAAQCFNATIIRADLKTALQAAFSAPPAPGITELAVQYVRDKCGGWISKDFSNQAADALAEYLATALAAQGDGE